jgi:hypothetical protein
VTAFKAGEPHQKGVSEAGKRHYIMRGSIDRQNYPLTSHKIEEARAILRSAQSTADYDRADALLNEAETSELRAVQEAEVLERQAQEAWRRKRFVAAAIQAERGDLSLTRLEYLQASQHFKRAAEMAKNESGIRAGYLNSAANALTQYGFENGDNATLLQATGLYREAIRGVSYENEPARRTRP